MVVELVEEEVDGQRRSQYPASSGGRACWLRQDLLHRGEQWSLESSGSSDSAGKKRAGGKLEKTTLQWQLKQSSGYDLRIGGDWRGTGEEETTHDRRRGGEIFGQQVVGMGMKQGIGWSFLGGSRTISGPTLGGNVLCKKCSAVYASCNYSHFFVLFHDLPSFLYRI